MMIVLFLKIQRSPHDYNSVAKLLDYIRLKSLSGLLSNAIDYPALLPLMNINFALFNTYPAYVFFYIP